MSICTATLFISVNATDLKIEQIIPVNAMVSGSYDTCYLVQTADGCSFFVDDVNSPNRTLLTEKTKILSESFIITENNDLYLGGNYGIYLSFGGSLFSKCYDNVLQYCKTDTQEFCLSTEGNLLKIGYVMGKYRGSSIMSDVREIGSFSSEKIYVITKDNTLYIGNQYGMDFVSNNVYKFQNSLITDFNGLVSYYDGEDYPVALCKCEDLDAEMYFFIRNSSQYVCINVATPKANDTTVITHQIFNLKSLNCTNAFNNLDNFYYLYKELIIKEHGKDFLKVYDSSGFFPGNTNNNIYDIEYYSDGTIKLRHDRVEYAGDGETLLFFDKNDILVAKYHCYSGLKKLPDFQSIGGVSSVVYSEDSYSEKNDLFLLITKNGKVYMTDRNFNYIESTTLHKQNINLIINDKKQTLKAEIQNINGRTMYPFRECLEALGVTVSWNAVDRIAVGMLPGTTIEFPIDQNKYYINGKEYKMDTSTYISSSGYTYIPIRYAAEAFGYSVKWQPGIIENSVILTKE